MPELTTEEQELSNEITPAATPAEQAPASAPAPSGTPANKPVDDPEIDLGVGDDGQPLKLKKSQILKERMLQSDYTKKTQELSAQREQIKEMFNIVEHLKSNPKKAERIIAILDEKEEAAQDKVDEIDEVLKTLDPNDPYAKSLMAMRKQNQQLLKTTQELQNKLGTFEQKTQSFEEKEAVKQAETVLTKALDDITKTLKFEDDDDKADWRKAVLTFLVNNPKKYASEDEFKSVISEVGRSEYDALVKRIERITGRYIKSKGGAGIPAHPAGGGAKPLSRKPSMGGRGEEDNLQEIIEEELKNEEAGNT